MSGVSAARRFMTVAEVNDLTGIPVDTLRYWRYKRTGGPKSFRLGRRVMYERAEVERWLTEQASA